MASFLLEATGGFEVIIPIAKNRDNIMYMSPFNLYAHTDAFLNYIGRKLMTVQMATASMTPRVLGILVRANWQSLSTHRPLETSANATGASQGENTKVNSEIEKESSSERRDLLFAPLPKSRWQSQNWGKVFPIVA